MNREEALHFISSTSWVGMKPGLDRITELMKRLGHPEEKLDFIHIAGTNGKGSTAVMLASIYQAAGYKTGLFTSPHLLHFNERIKVNGQDISDENFCRMAEKVAEAAQGMEDAPTEFEITTAMAILYFAEEKVRPAILEVGLGGELDSTNVIPAPLAAVICRLGMDHTAILGDTIEEIAQAKAGIIKHGSLCFAYPSQKEALEVIRAQCRKLDVPLQLADSSRVTPREQSLKGQSFDWLSQSGKKLEDLRLPLLGAYQLHNVALVLETVEGLSSPMHRLLSANGLNGSEKESLSAHALDGLGRGMLPVSEEAIRQGLASVVWPARFEILRHDPLFIVDGSHNPQGAESLGQLLNDYLPGQKLTFLMGIMADKDVEDYLDFLLSHAQRVICVRPDNPRAMDPERLAQLIEKKGVSAEAVSSVDEGVSRAESFGDPVLACGSFYMAGAIREHVLSERKGTFR